MKSQTSIYSRYFTYIKPVTRLPIVKTYGSTIFTLLIISIFIFFAIKPTTETIIVLQKKLDDSNAVLKKVNQKVNDLSLGKTNYEKLPINVKLQIETAIPDNARLKSVIQTLEQTAKNHEASISALQIQPLVLTTKSNSQLGTLSEITFTFNIEGAYEQLIAILQDLKSSARLISIDNLSIAKLSEGPGLIMSISGKAYFIK